MYSPVMNSGSLGISAETGLRGHQNYGPHPPTPGTCTSCCNSGMSFCRSIFLKRKYIVCMPFETSTTFSSIIHCMWDIQILEAKVNDKTVILLTFDYTYAGQNPPFCRDQNRVTEYVITLLASGLFRNQVLRKAVQHICIS